MHVALWVLTATSILGAAVCLLRPSHASVTADANAATAADAAAEERSPIRPWEEALADEAPVPAREETIDGDQAGSPTPAGARLGSRA